MLERGNSGLMSTVRGNLSRDSLDITQKSGCGGRHLGKRLLLAVMAETDQGLLIHPSLLALVALIEANEWRSLKRQATLVTSQSHELG